MLKAGDRAPEFTLVAQDGGKVTLSSFQGRKSVVLFFYPKDDTPICTLEARAFRDEYDAFRQAGAEVFGISSDSQESHKEFSARQCLPFTILSDPAGEVRKAYGVPKALGLIPGRATYVIDREGVIRHAYSSPFRAAAHVREALAALGRLS